MNGITESVFGEDDDDGNFKIQRFCSADILNIISGNFEGE